MGTIYILENEGMPGIIKIGRTDRQDVEQRVRELSSSTAVPYPFHCVYAASVEDVVLVERQIHMAFACHRIRKEFFKMPAHCVVSILELVATSIVTPRKGSQPPPSNVTPIVRPLGLLLRQPDVRGSDYVLAALANINRPVSNDELAALMSVTKSEASRRMKETPPHYVSIRRHGRFYAITLTDEGRTAASNLPPPPAVIPLTAEVR